VTKKKGNYSNVFICKRCGRETIQVSRGSASAMYCNSCANGLGECGTGDLLEFPCRDSKGNIDFSRERYEVERELEKLGLKNKKKRHKKH
jgi:hypothetical protein